MTGNRDSVLHPNTISAGGQSAGTIGFGADIYEKSIGRGGLSWSF